ncbi:PH domain-containing protein [Algibacter pectinivorans]|uniref:PH domain-containing protein n=1 Tax=Algibacter pectinivorans TaxID=870482 RepID=A0A1I1QJI0_9FLAO|nr:PH domain-containing protein [Algibacter pectinivorans]SFD22132.1 PH domain-containing protein [Algibacter pectinivorans]
MKIYRSKISYGFLLAIFILFGIISYFNITDSNSTLKLILIVNSIHVITFLFLLFVFYSTRYTIENDTLKIECGFIYKKEIKVNEIKSITKTNSILSSPAASLTDRILVKFGANDSIIISPKNKKEFLIELIKLNPNIKNKLNT